MRSVLFPLKAKTIPVERAFRKWRKDPAYCKAYGALAGQFALARAFVAARARAGLTQAEVAKSAWERPRR
jgi:hypothetical protein